MNTGTLTVLFEDPFWIGLFEKTDNEGLHVCKVTFGAEPKNNVSSTCARPKGKRNIEDIKLEYNYGKN